MNPLLVVVAAIALLMVAGAGIALLGNRGSYSQRMDEFVTAGEVEMLEAAMAEMPSLDMAGRMDEALARRGYFEPIRKRIAMADLRLRVSEYVALQILLGVGLAVLGYAILGRNLLVVVFFVFGLVFPRIYVNFAANRRLRAFEEQLSDTLNLWVNALRSGYSVLQALEAIAAELPKPISKEFERVVQEVRLGLSMPQALGNMLRRMPSEDLDLIITAVNIQREVGGNLAEILDIISHTIRERVRIKGEIRTLTAQGRLTGWVVSLLPVGLALALYSINPEYGGQLYIQEDPFLAPGLPCGWLVIALGIIMIIAGVFAVRRIVDIEV